MVSLSKIITVEDLVSFEKDIEKHWINGEVKAPIHFSGSKDKVYEQSLIDIFKQVRQEDWCFSNHRSHYHALLKGVPPDLVKTEILAGHSMQLNFKDYRFFTSSIVAGAVPIAVGVALGIKRSGGSEKVWLFIGDMASETGIYYESRKYAERNNLPIHFVIENDGVSVNSPTKETWGLCNTCTKVITINYERLYPHAGVGKWIQFV